MSSPSHQNYPLAKLKQDISNFQILFLGSYETTRNASDEVTGESAMPIYDTKQKAQLYLDIYCQGLLPSFVLLKYQGIMNVRPQD